jgi:hypothetical protein
MLFHSYLRNAIVYVPTVVKLQTGAYMDVDPVAVVPVANTDGLRHALLDAIARENAIVPAEGRLAASGLARIRRCEDLVGIRARCIAMEYQSREVPNCRVSNA